MIVSLLKMALETVKLEHLHAIGRKQGGSIWCGDQRTWLADSKNYYRYFFFRINWLQLIGREARSPHGSSVE